MSVRISPSEFFDKCLLIKYSDEEDITEFGRPMTCYGMVYWFYKLCLAIELEKGKVERLTDVKFVEYKQVENPANNDIVFMYAPTNRISGQHAGIYRDGYIYHFTYDGLRVVRHEDLRAFIRGYFHVDESKNS